ncbi:MAG: Gfo/Idh/MocA family oxidoreductase, partial [Nocardioides sp.]
MTRDPVRIAVIGTGRIGGLHARLLAREVPGAALAAVADAVPGVAERVGDELGAPATSIDGALSAPEVDAVAICTSTETHVDLVVRAAEAGKAVFCEKPVSLDVAEVDR